MAVAGLKRIGREDRISEYLSSDVCLSAVAQGALGLECRDGDSVSKEIDFLHHPPTATEVAAERAFLSRLGGGCHVPVGGRAWADRGRIRLAGVVADPEGLELFRGDIAGQGEDAEKLGRELAEDLLKKGAHRVLVPAQESSGEINSGHVSKQTRS